MVQSFDAAKAAATPRVPQSTNTTGQATAPAGGVREADTKTGWDANPTSAPAKADAAPAGNTTKAFTGLCDALNAFQQSLVRPGGYKIADVYEIQFNPTSIASAKVSLKGEAYKATPLNQEKTPNAQLNQEAQRMDLTGRIVDITAGTQIVQFIDQIMRQSSYITDQANFIFEESTGKLLPKPNASNDSDVQWYKINFQTENLGWDEGRNDYAYKMIYTITPYTINKLDSQYFPEGRYHGVHKSYNYWFTGKNNSVINFEQDYNNMYFTILSGTTDGVGNGTTVPFGLTNATAPDPIGKDKSTSNIPKSYAPASSQSNQGAQMGVNEIGASAADYLYSMTTAGEVTMRIIGDPAWIPQGEVTNSVNAATMTFAPFFPDGTINFDAGQVMFDVYFNRPADYDFNTGIVNVNGQTINPGGSLAALQPQAHLTYTCSKVKSFFMQGKFEQELTGLLYKDAFDTASAKAKAARDQATVEREVASNKTTEAAGVRDSSVNPVDKPNPDLANSGTNNNDAPAGDITNPSPQPASPASRPVSNGDLSVPAVSSAPANATATPEALRNPDYADEITKAQTNQALADQAAARGDVYAAAYYNNIAKNNRENAAANAASAAKYGVQLNTQSQTMAPKDDA